MIHGEEARGERGAAQASPARRPRTRPPVAVRVATPADLATVVELRLALLAENADHAIYGRLRPDARTRAFAVFGAQLRAPQEVMFLAERAGRAVGILRCVDTPTSPLFVPERYCYVSSVYVRPQARRAGVLEALLRAADGWCGERGLTEMRLHNVPGGVAAAAWEACGFAVVEQVRLRRL